MDKNKLEQWCLLVKTALEQLNRSIAKESQVPIYWKEYIGSEMVRRLVSFENKKDLEAFIYGKWYPIGDKKPILAKAMEEHILFFEVDGTEILFEANYTFADKQKSLGQKDRELRKD